MTRTGQAAIDYARSRVGTTMPDSGLCLQFVRTCFDVPSYYYSAIDAWNGSPTKHPDDWNPPPGVPLFFRSPSQYDHVVFCCSTGELVSTFNAEIRSYPSIEAVCSAFDASLLGWTEDINRVTVWTGEGEDDMPTAQEVADAVWGYALHRPNGPVADAGSYLVDARVLLGDPAAALVPVSDQVWATVIKRPNGPHTDAGTYLVDTRASVAPVTAGPVLVSDQVWSDVPDAVVGTVSARGGAVDLFVVALLILLAVVGGVAIGLLAETRDGVVAGSAVLIGGLLALILRNLPGARSRSSDD